MEKRKVVHVIKKEKGKGKNKDRRGRRREGLKRSGSR
jgi:hypothetical protein